MNGKGESQKKRINLKKIGRNILRQKKNYLWISPTNMVKFQKKWLNSKKCVKSNKVD